VGTGSDLGASASATDSGSRRAADISATVPAAGPAVAASLGFAFSTGFAGSAGFASAGFTTGATVTSVGAFLVSSSWNVRSDASACTCSSAFDFSSSCVSRSAAGFGSAASPASFLPTTTPSRKTPPRTTNDATVMLTISRLSNDSSYFSFSLCVSRM
jgi:hypothetical protein